MLTIIFFSIIIISYAKSYIIIQGDQITPIYVKVEGKMMPRFSMHHSIIPNLGAGLTNFEVLFQENKIPPQKFKIFIPEDGSRSLIVAIQDKKVSLYDLNSKMYINVNNIEDNTYLPIVSSDEFVFNNGESKLPPLEPARRGKKSENSDEVILGFSTKRGENENNKKEKEKENERFLANVNLDENISYKEADKAVRLEEIKRRNEAKLSNNSLEKKEENNNNNKSATSSENGNCTAMNNIVFDNIASMFIELKSDEDKIKMIKNNLATSCFSIQQVKILANEIQSPSARFELVKMLYNVTSDKEQFHQLEDSFNSNFLKQKVKELYSGQ